MTSHYKDVAEAELDKLEQYKLVYEATNPFPEKEDVSFWKELGFEAGALIASALGSITLSAIRTSTIFMLTEALLIAAFDKEQIIPQQITSGFPLISMISSLVAFEGMLSAHGFIQGKNSHSIEVSPVAMWFCFGVTITAGLSASFGLLGLNTENVVFLIVSWALAVLTAVGAPVVAYYGAKNLGVILNKWADIRERTEKAFADAVRSWNSSFLSSFSGKRSQKMFNERSQRTNGGNEQRERSSMPTQRTNATNERRDQIIEILDYHFSGNGNEIIGVSDVAKILATEEGDPNDYERYKGYVSKVRKEWLEENNLV